MTRSRVILLDVESRSRADLKAVGGRLYWAHPSSEILVLAWYDTDAPGDGVHLWQPGDPTPWWAVGGAYKRPPLVAHNALGFDRFAVERALRIPIAVHENGGRWIDTTALARRAGLPGALDALGTLWLGLPKDKAASKFTRSLSTVRRPIKRTAHLSPGGEAISADEWRELSTSQKRERGVLPEITPEDFARVAAYCRSDVEIMVHAWPHLEPWRDFEPEIFGACCALNDRGVGFDVALARRLLQADADNARAACAVVAETLGASPEEVAAAARSPAQFTALTGAPNAQASTVEGMLDDPGIGGMLARVRVALASIASGKLEAGLRRALDGGDGGRLYDTQRYLGAHTWRWSGQGMQLQNMPRPAGTFEGVTGEAIDALADAVISGTHHPDQEEIDLLLRACIYAPEPGRALVVADLTGIEQRALAWVAQDAVTFDTLARGLDPYKVAAAAVFGAEYDQIEKPQRTVGKVAELASGYGGGPNALMRMAAGYGVDFAEVGVVPADVTSAWRELHWAVVAFWREIESAFRDVALGRTGDDGIALGGPNNDVFTIAPSSNGRDVAVWMPTGRPLVYRDVRVKRESTPWGMRDEMSFHFPTKNMREKLYGGKLTENVIQALCREVFALGLARAEAHELLTPVMTVHDELVSECDASRAEDALAAQIECMTARPGDWAAGFPISADGFVARRYRK